MSQVQVIENKTELSPTCVAGATYVYLTASPATLHPCFGDLSFPNKIYCAMNWSWLGHEDLYTLQTSFSWWR